MTERQGMDIALTNIYKQLLRGSPGMTTNHAESRRITPIRGPGKYSIPNARINKLMTGRTLEERRRHNKSLYIKRG